MNVLITGASGGIGSSILEKYRAAGFNVIYPTSAELDLRSDISIKLFCENHHAVDVFVHCAGINNPKSFSDIKQEDIATTNAVNLNSCIQIIQSLMKGRNAPLKVVLLSSLWSIRGRAGRIPYSISKAGLDALVRGLACELGDRIIINSVIPGFVDTPLTRKNLNDEEIENICNMTPTAKLVGSDEVAELVLFLSSVKNNSITGQSIIIDGGFSILGY